MKILSSLLSVFSILFLCEMAFAGILAQPPIIKDKNTSEYLRSIYDNHNNLFVVTVNPNGNRRGNFGDIVIYNKNGIYKIYECISTPSGTSWVDSSLVSYYGNMYGDEISQSVTILATDTYYHVSGGLTGGTSQGFTFQNSKELKCVEPGKYLVMWSLSIKCATNNQDTSGCVMINSTAQLSTTSHHFIGAGASKNSVVTGNGILTLAVDDLVRVAVANHTGTNNLEIEHLNLSLIKVDN